MVVCKYFLNGSCRFGDRCKNEHPGAKPFSSFGGGNSGFGRATDRTTSKNVCQYFLQGKCHFGNTCKFAHTTAGSGQNGFGSKPSFGGQSTFGQTRSGISSKNTFNTNQNRFGVLSNTATMGGQSNAFGSSNQQQPTTEAMLQNPTHVTQIQQIVRRDMETWESSKQWPLSCYTYLKDEPCLPGLMDFSPEEIRKAAYDAKTNNSASAYQQGLNSLLEKSKQRRLQLKNINTHQLQSEIRSSMSKSSTGSAISTQSTNQSRSLAGGMTSLSQSGSLFSSGASAGGGLFGLSSMQQSLGTTSTMSVDMGSQSSQPSGSTGTSSLFGSTNTGLFGTKGPSSTTPFGTGNTSTNNTSSLFGTSTVVSQPGTGPQTTFGNPAASSAQPTTTTSTAPQSIRPLTCSEADIAAFKADKFVLGKIPECPPPPELCT